MFGVRTVEISAQDCSNSLVYTTTELLGVMFVSLFHYQWLVFHRALKE